MLSVIGLPSPTVRGYLAIDMYLASTCDSIDLAPVSQSQAAMQPRKVQHTLRFLYYLCLEHHGHIGRKEPLQRVKAKS